MEDKIYQVLKKHKLPLKKREELIVDLLPLFSVNESLCENYNGCPMDGKNLKDCSNKDWLSCYENTV